MKTLIIGKGEIGKSIYNIFNEYYDCRIVGREKDCNGPYEVMHVCFTYNEKFISEVKRYRRLYNPKYIVVHSTVPVGTCRKLGVIHSPVVGLHPFLEESIKTFTKFLGGRDASYVADYFRRANIKCYITDKSDTTELMKMCSTTYHGLTIEYTKEIKRLCTKYDVPFELWTIWNQNYCSGYEKLGHPEYRRPDLLPIMKKIGGHCVLPNLEILDSKFSKFIKELNK